MRFVAVKDAPVIVRVLQQLLVRSLGDDFSLAQHDDVVGPANLGKSMRNEDGGAAFRSSPDGLLDEVLGGAVNRAGAVVKNEHGGIGDEGAGERNALTLAAAKCDTALADDCVVIRQGRTG